jgi:hypothetical protein
MSLIRISRAARLVQHQVDEAKKAKIKLGAKAKTPSVIGPIPTDIDPKKPGAKENDAPEQVPTIAPVVLSSPNVSAEESVSVLVPHEHADASAESDHLKATIHPLAKTHGGKPHPSIPHEIVFPAKHHDSAVKFASALPSHLRAKAIVSHNGDESVLSDAEGNALFEEFAAVDSHKARISTVTDHATLKRVHAHLHKASKLPGISSEKKAHYSALKSHLTKHAASQGLQIETSGGDSDLPAPQTAADVISQAGFDEPAPLAGHDESVEADSFLARLSRAASGKTLMDECKDKLSSAGVELGAETAAFALIETMLHSLVNEEHVVHVGYKIHGAEQAKHTVHHLVNHAVKAGAHKFDAEGYDGHVKLHFKKPEHAKAFHAFAASAAHVHRSEVKHVAAHECFSHPSAEQVMNEDGIGPNKIGPAGSCVVRLTKEMGDAHMPLDKLLTKFGGLHNAGGGYKFPCETAQSFLNWYMRNGGKGYIDIGDGKKYGPNEDVKLELGVYGLPESADVLALLGSDYWCEDDTIGCKAIMDVNELSEKLSFAKMKLSKHNIDATLRGKGNFQALKVHPKLDNPKVIVNLCKHESIEEANHRSPVGHVSLRHNGLFTKNPNGNWVKMSNKARLHLLAKQKAKAHKDDEDDEKDDEKKKHHKKKHDDAQDEAVALFKELTVEEQDVMKSLEDVKNKLHDAVKA